MKNNLIDQITGPLIGKNAIIFENDNYKFYSNNMTQSATNYSKEKWRFEHFVVLLGIEKVASKFCGEIFNMEEELTTPDMTYVLIDNKENEFIYDTKSYEGMLYHMDFYGIAKRSNET